MSFPPAQNLEDVLLVGTIGLSNTPAAAAGLVRYGVRGCVVLSFFLEMDIVLSSIQNR